jgi:pre-mRNA 3'-end-processing factor FIP1
MSEDQLNTLPAEIRSMVMMASGNANAGPAGMMPGGMNMNGAMMNPMMNPMMNMGPMMEMGQVDMGMGGPGMGMGMGPGIGDQGMGGQGMGGAGMGGQVMGGQGMGGQGMGAQGMGGQGMGGPGMGGGNMNSGALSGGVAMSSGGQGQLQGRGTPDIQMGMGGENYTGTPPVQGQLGQIPMGGDFGMQVSYLR